MSQYRVFPFGFADHDAPNAATVEQAIMYAAGVAWGCGVDVSVYEKRYDGLSYICMVSMDAHGNHIITMGMPAHTEPEPVPDNPVVRRMHFRNREPREPSAPPVPCTTCDSQYCAR